jgi:hypothetical protein
MNNKSQEFDWVAKRAACTVAAVFNELCDAIKGDVIAINSARSLSPVEIFEAKMVRGDCITVRQPNLFSTKTITITASDSEIVVNGDWDGTKSWSATVGLNDEGLCVLRLEDGKDRPELEQWQFRKRALEGLFFGYKP